MSLKNAPDKKNKNLSKDIDRVSKSISSEYKMFYDFYEDAWIGYLPCEEFDQSLFSKIVKENKDLKKINANMSETLEMFKTNGIQHIETDYQTNSDFLRIFMETHNYDYLDSERLVSRLSLDDIILSPKYNDKEFLISQMNSLDLHYEPSFLKSNKKSKLEENVINFLTDKENISKESLRLFFEYLKKNPDKIISQTTLMDSESIQGYSMVVRTRWNKNTGILSFLDIKNTDQPIKDLIIAQSILDCKMNNIDQIEVHIRDDVMEKENAYLSYGFEFSNVHRFQLND